MALDLKEIQELIKFVAKSGASEVALEIGEMKISIKTPPKKGKNSTETIVQQTPPSPINLVNSDPSLVVQPIIQKAHDGALPSNDESPSPEDLNSKYITIKSPMIGTFYRQPSPDKDSFVSIGDEVSEGSVVCIIEAMKLFNEIESEISGKIIKVLVDDMSPIEYDQPLFLVDPS